MPQKKRHITHMGVLWKYSICYFEIHSRDGILPGSLCFQCFGHILYHFFALSFFFLLPKREGKDIRVEVKFPKVIALVRYHPCLLKIVVRKRTLDIATKITLKNKGLNLKKRRHKSSLRFYMCYREKNQLSLKFNCKEVLYIYQC